MVQQNWSEVLATLVLVILLFAGLISGITFQKEFVVAANVSNTTTHVNVTNTEPYIKNLTIYPNPVTLNAGSTINVSCIAEVFDWNGVSDYYNASAVFFQQNQGVEGSLDNNIRYFANNDSCFKTQVDASNYTINCTVNVWYYANNGSWNCSMTIYDDGGGPDPHIRINTTTFANSSTNISTLLAVDVPALLEYGNLTVTQTSAEKQLNITNYGNIPMNVSVRAFANNNDGLNRSLTCDYGAIPVEYERWTIYSGLPYAQMNLSSNLSSPIHNLTFYQRTNDTDFGNDRNSTYWRLQIPLGVGGSCNGTLQFAASIA